MKEWFLAVASILIVFYILFSMFEYRFQRVKETYPYLTRGEYLMLGQHLKIEPQKKHE